MLLRPGAHGRQVAVAELAVDEGRQVTLGMFVMELFDDLGHEFLRHAFVEARTGGRALQAAVLDVLADEQDVKHHFQLRHVHPQYGQRRDLGQHVGLLGVTLVDQSAAVRSAKPLLTTRADDRRTGRGQRRQPVVGNVQERWRKDAG